MVKARDVIDARNLTVHFGKLGPAGREGWKLARQRCPRGHGAGKPERRGRS